MTPWDDTEVRVACERLILGVHAHRRRQKPGSMPANRPGSSLEFHDYRAYQPGDDLRRMDWSVFARTRQLVLRRREREVGPTTELVLDTSLSMRIDPAKAALAQAITALVGRLAVRVGDGARLWLCGQRTRRLALSQREWVRQMGEHPWEGATGLECEPGPSLAPGSQRIVISDGLCPGGGARVVRRLGGRAGSICLVQLLTTAERAPQPIGAARLQDIEGGQRELVVDSAACERYRVRLERHQRGWRDALAGRGAGLVECAVEDGLEGAVRALTAAGLVVPIVS